MWLKCEIARRNGEKSIEELVEDSMKQKNIKVECRDESGKWVVFTDELTYIITHQLATFNSPVWFNIGAINRKQQSSACFLLDVQDSMESILNNYLVEGMIFKGGSGSGINISKLRAKG